MFQMNRNYEVQMNRYTPDAKPDDHSLATHILFYIYRTNGSFFVVFLQYQYFSDTTYSTSIVLDIYQLLNRFLFFLCSNSIILLLSGGFFLLFRTDHRLSITTSGFLWIVFRYFLEEKALNEGRVEIGGRLRRSSENPGSQLSKAQHAKNSWNNEKKG